MGEGEQAQAPLVVHMVRIVTSINPGMMTIPEDYAEGAVVGVIYGFVSNLDGRTAYGAFDYVAEADTEPRTARKLALPKYGFDDFANANPNQKMAIGIRVLVGPGRQPIYKRFDHVPT